MADVKQIYQIVNSIAEQALGMTGLEATDVSFISVGNNVLSSDESRDAFFNVLMDRIGRTVIAIREYHANDSELKREPIEWGLALQKLSFGLPDAVQSETWKSQTTAAKNPFDKATSVVKQKIFSEFTAWQIDGTVPDVQLRTAFTSAENMGAFISGLMLSWNNSMEVKTEALANLCRAAFIARRSQETDNGARYINLLAKYNTETNKSLTVANCKFDRDFLAFVAMTLMLYTDRLSRMNTLFNDDNDIPRFTPKELQVVNVNSEWARRMDTYLYSNTFHDELVALPYYKPVPYWQGTGEGYDIADTTSISVKLDGEAETEVSNVLAVIYDRDAMGITVQNKRTKTIYNPNGEYTNYFLKMDLGYYNDMSEQGVVFYIAET